MTGFILEGGLEVSLNLLGEHIPRQRRFVYFIPSNKST